MAELSYFESRSGKPSCTPEQIFTFLSDVRNFERFVPPGSVVDWMATKDSCSFTIPRVGDVRLSIVQKEENRLIAFKGNAIKNNFDLILYINRRPDDKADVKAALNAELNPMMKMIASKPIGQFLEMIIERIENFNCQDEVV